MTFRDIYKPPFVIKLDGIYAFSDNGTKSFTAFSPEAKAHLKRIVKLLNGEEAEKYSKGDVVFQDTKLCVCGHIIIVRGWGALIGSGGYHIPRDEAAKIQDDFTSWVVETITE